MNKQLGAIMIVAGTCIGGGVIALPLTLAKLGILCSLALMAFVWFFTYYSAVINLELVLQSKKPLNIGKLGTLYSGPVASVIGTSALKGLMFALMSAYIYGVTSMFSSLGDFGLVSQKIITIGVAIVAYLFLILPVGKIDATNRVLFITTIIIAGMLILAMAFSLDFSKANFVPDNKDQLSSWVGVIPVIFTSFGFQVLFHTLSEYCDMNAKVLKKVFFVGSIIPLIVYTIWTCSVLYVTHTNDQSFYLKIVQGHADVGELIQRLSVISNAKYLQSIVWVVSILAVVTSMIGVGLGLCDSLRQYTITKNQKLAAGLAVFPPCLIAMVVPNAFIALLGCAGMILSILAILLPVYLLIKADFKVPIYQTTKNYVLLGIIGIFGLCVIGCEIASVMGWLKTT
jgi:tyrosine-specific transport protein